MGPLRHRDFRLLWIGWVLGATASWVHQVVSLWLILELTDSALMLGLSGVFMSAPFLITSLYGGALADRIDRRKLLVVSQGIATLLAVIPGVLSALDVIKVWHIYALSSLSWTVAAFDAPARQALIPSLIPQKDLMSAIALTSVIRRGTALVGPMMGGLSITAVGVSGAFFLHAIINGVVLVTLLGMKPQKDEIRPRHTSMARSILEGLHLMRTNRLIFSILSIEAAHTLLVSYQQLMPIFARDILKIGPTGLGLLYSAPGVGAVLGSVFLVRVGDIPKKGRVLFITALLQPVTVFLFGISPWIATSMLMLMFSGLLDVVGGTVRNTVLQLLTREEMRGRVMGMNMMVHRGLGPLSGLPSGALATLMGAPLAISTGVTLFLVYAVSLFLRIPELHRYPEGEPLPTSSQAPSSAPP